MGIVKEPGISPPALLPSDERALVIGCRDGDPASLDRFFRTYFAYVARVIGRLIGSTPDLQDLVHATFIEAIVRLVSPPDVKGGIWTPGAAMGDRLIKRLTDHAGLTFAVEG